jgi:hypothetical protein
MVSVPIKSFEKMTTMDLTAYEARLIFRLRLLRKQGGAPHALLVTVSPVTVSIIGQLELIEDGKPVYTSGSGFGDGYGGSVVGM